MPTKKSKRKSAISRRKRFLQVENNRNFKEMKKRRSGRGDGAGVERD